MKTHSSQLLFVCLLFAIISFCEMPVNAQAPQAIPYQAAARDNSGNAMVNQNISLRFTIHDATATGTVVYQETQGTTTSSLGLFSVNIGQGTPATGTFSAINWGTSSKFLQVEMDAAGGTSYIDMGTTQMLSVPYALYAASSANLPNGNANGNTLRWNGSSWVIDSTLTNKQTNIGIGITSPNSSALLDLSSTTKGFTMPRMTTTQRDAITSPAVGLQIFNTDDQCVNIYDGTYWIATCGLKVTGSLQIPGTDAWTQKANFGGTARHSAAGFSIGSKGYIGTGVDASLRNDFWEYDPSTNAWTQRANFGGTARQFAVGFSIGTKGYIGTGYDGTIRNDFWEYDPSANTWTQKASFGGAVRYLATGFSIGSKGYIGTGFDGVSLRNDFWEYNPATNTWIQKSNFGGSARDAATGFSIGNKGYLGTGLNPTYQTDFWEYDPASNTWTQKAGFGGAARAYAAGFSISSKGYIGTGIDISNNYKTDFWEYDPTANTWTQKAAFGGVARGRSVGFSINGYGYIGVGTDAANTLKSDFWEYKPYATGYSYSSLGPSSSSAVSDNAWTVYGTNIFNSNSGNVGIGTTSPASMLHTIASGAKTSNYSGNLFTSTATSTSSNVTKAGVEIQSTGSWNGTSANNIGLYVSSVTGGTNNYDAIFNGGGNVGIGVTAPAGILHTAASGAKTSNYSGNLFTNAATSSTSGITKAAVEIKSTGTWNGTSASNIGILVSAMSGGTNNYDAIFNGGGNVGIGTAAPTSILHTVASGAKTANFAGNLFTNSSTSSTASITKSGVEIQSTGTWNGSGANNIGLYVSSVTGGANNYDAIFNGGGNVGIGTASPFAILHTVASGAKTSNYSGNLLTSTATSSTFGIIKAGVEIQSTGTWTGSSARNIGLYVSSVTGGTNNYDAVFNGGGNVGIGTASPASMLHTIASGAKTANYTGNLFTNVATSSTSSLTKAGVEIQSTGAWNGTTASNIGLYISAVTGGTANYDAIFNGGGSVGIGTTAPTHAKLEINGTLSSTLSYGFLNNLGNIGSASGTNGYSLYCSARVAATEFNAYSDARIKHVIGRTNNENDLATLMKIQVTDYSFIDTITRGTQAYKKVIAQEVEKVYPTAVSTTHEFIPNMYRLSSIDKGFIALADSSLKPGDKVKLIFADGEQIAEVKSVTKNGFLTDCNKEGNVFVFGREVNDFRTVDYEALSMLNISATQSLVKKIDHLEKDNALLKADNAAIKTDIEKIKSQLGMDAKAER